MRSIPPLLALAGSPFLLGAQDAAPVVRAPSAAPPPIGAPAPIGVMLVSFERLSLSCGGEAVAPVVERQPYEGIGWLPPKKEAAPISLEFRVDVDGRPLSIRRMPGSDAFVPGNEDLAPALAAWRFEPAHPRERCTVTFRPRATPIAEAPYDRLAHYYATPHPNAAWDRQVFEALEPDGADCDRPRPAPRTIRYPDYEKVSQALAAASFALAGYDLNARGVPRNVRILASSGNAALDRGAIKAIAGSRFARGARQGCVVRFGPHSLRTAGNQRRVQALGQLQGRAEMAAHAAAALSGQFPAAVDRGLGSSSLRHRALGAGRQRPGARERTRGGIRHRRETDRRSCAQAGFGARL